MSGVQLVAVDADMETKPVGVRLCCHLSGGRELLLLLVPIFAVPRGGKKQENRERRGLLLRKVLAINDLLKTAVPENHAGDKTLHSHNRRVCYFFFLKVKLLC